MPPADTDKLLYDSDELQSVQKVAYTSYLQIRSDSDVGSPCADSVKSIIFWKMEHFGDVTCL